MFDNTENQEWIPFDNDEQEDGTLDNTLYENED